jgi:hypothetical protein
VEGGKHYGHLEVNVEQLASSRGRDRNDAPGSPHVRVTFTPVHVFPVLDVDYALVRTERRVYADEITLHLEADGRVMAP